MKNKIFLILTIGLLFIGCIENTGDNPQKNNNKEMTPIEELEQLLENQPRDRYIATHYQSMHNSGGGGSSKFIISVENEKIKKVMGSSSLTYPGGGSNIRYNYSVSQDTITFCNSTGKCTKPNVTELEEYYLASKVSQIWKQELKKRKQELKEIGMEMLIVKTQTDNETCFTTLPKENCGSLNIHTLPCGIACFDEEGYLIASLRGWGGSQGLSRWFIGEKPPQIKFEEQNETIKEMMRYMQDYYNKTMY